MSIYDVILKILKAEIAYLRADWWILLIAIMTAAVVQVYIGQDRIQEWLKNNSSISIPGSVGFASFTPLCSCGTMAVIISMFVTTLPWGPVMAFLVSSPLSSPSQFIIQSGVLGFDLALAVLISSIVMGLFAGFGAVFLEKRTNFLKDQYRISVIESKHNITKNSISNSIKNKKNNITQTDDPIQTCCDNVRGGITKYKFNKLAKVIYELGLKKILPYFMVFIALGQVIEVLIPTEWILALFSSDSLYSVPLAAVIGLPLYVSGSSALPMLKSFMDLGAGAGSIMAFLIAGQGTSLAVIAGISTFIKKRAIALYIVLILMGSIFTGYLYQLIIRLR